MNADFKTTLLFHFLSFGISLAFSFIYSRSTNDILIENEGEKKEGWNKTTWILFLRAQTTSFPVYIS